LNWATVIGIVAGVVILSLATVFSTESVTVFINLPGLAIVLGGTMAAIFICYPLKDVMRVFGTFLLALKREELPMGEYIRELVLLAKKASSQGKISLESELSGIENQFLQSAVQMLVDGYARDELEEIMDTTIEQTYDREMRSAGIFRTMARLSPAFGITGTLIGLIAMMQTLGSNLGDIGAGIAVAFTTTLYGILMANLICMPIAVKVEQRIEERLILMQVIRDGVLYIKDKAPAGVVLNKLKAYLPARRWDSIRKAKAKKG
jgi:chemotaxis protein MotA